MSTINQKWRKMLFAYYEALCIPSCCYKFQRAQKRVSNIPWRSNQMQCAAYNNRRKSHQLQSIAAVLWIRDPCRFPPHWSSSPSWKATKKPMAYTLINAVEKNSRAVNIWDFMPIWQLLLSRYPYPNLHSGEYCKIILFSERFLAAYLSLIYKALTIKWVCERLSSSPPCCDHSSKKTQTVSCVSEKSFIDAETLENAVLNTWSVLSGLKTLTACNKNINIQNVNRFEKFSRWSDGRWNSILLSVSLNL